MIRENRKFHLEQGTWAEEDSLMKQMLWESQNDVAKLNSRNNKKMLDKSQIGTWQYTYNSSARNVVRMWWLSTFIAHLLTQLVETETSLIDCLKSAYTVGFADHHSWVVRKGAGLAMHAAGKREGFYKLAGVTDANDFRNGSTKI